MGYKNIKHSILFSFLFWVGSVQSGHAQETAGQEAVPEMQTAVFTPPFDFPITFSGNFGEIRSNHFHGGVGFKTRGVIGNLYRWCYRQTCACFGRRAYLPYPSDAWLRVCA